MRTVLDNLKVNVSIYSIFAVPGTNFVYALDKEASQVLKLILPIEQGVYFEQTYTHVYEYL